MLNDFTYSPTSVMRSILASPAIVLRSWPFGESDKIVSFLTERYGKITGIAKGAKRSRKRFANTLELFSLVNVRFQERAHSTLVFLHACELIRAFKDLITSLEKIAHASYLVEIVEGLTGEREENPILFEHLKDGLAHIEEKGPSLSFLVFFELKVLKLAGYQPMLERCRRCGKGWERSLKTPWRFSPADGGILCEFCSTLRRDVIPLSPEALEALLNLQKSDGISWEHALPPSVLEESRSALLQFIQYQTNKELKSARFIEAFSF